jgi:flagellar biogenesis protein FliO
MRSLSLTIRAGLFCLALGSSVASAQHEASEPMPLSRAIQVAAQPLHAAAADDSDHPTGGQSRSLPSFPFRQIGATEAASTSPPVSPRKLARRDSRPANSSSRAAAPTPSAAIGTVVSSLAIVLALFAGLVWLTRRMAPTGSQALPKEAVELLGRAPLAGRQTMQLVRIGNRLLLVAISPTGAQTLTEITDAVEVERLAALCQRGRPDSATASFDRVLSQLASEPTGGSPRSRVRGAA